MRNLLKRFLCMSMFFFLLNAQIIADMPWASDLEERSAKVIMCYKSLVIASKLFPKMFASKAEELSALVKKNRQDWIRDFESSQEKVYSELGINELRLLVGDDKTLEVMGNTYCYVLAFDYLDKMEQLLEVSK